MIPTRSQKSLWQDTDLADMSWHDCMVRAMAFDPVGDEFALDLDYALEWVRSAEYDGGIGFWMSPATLVFCDVKDVSIAINSGIPVLEIESIQCDDKEEIERSWPEGPLVSRRGWRISCQEGDMNFKASGFFQVIRSAPILTNNMYLDEPARGGISFSHVQYDATQLNSKPTRR